VSTTCPTDSVYLEYEAEPASATATACAAEVTPGRMMEAIRELGYAPTVVEG
jgi:hypothetical protein